MPNWNVIWKKINWKSSDLDRSCPERLPRRVWHTVVQEATRVDELVDVVGLFFRVTRRALRHLHADQGNQIGVLSLQVKKLGLWFGQLRLELAHLLLQMAYGTGTAVDRVSKPCIRLVHHAAHCIRSPGIGKFLEQDSNLLIIDKILCHYNN